MPQEEIEVRLRGLDASDGAISLGDLAPLAAALQLLATRIVRDVGGQVGPGRTAAPLEQMARLRLEGLGSGSTALVITAGDETLAIEHPLELETFERFWDVVHGLGEARRPGWVSPGVAEAALVLASALAAAEEVEFRGQRAGLLRRPVRLVPTSVDRSVWRLESEPARRAGVTVTGVLDLVDLRRRSFRIRDDVGHDIALDDVENAAQAGSLIGQRVAANGEAILGDRGRPLRLRSAVVTSTGVPAEWTAAGRSGWQALAPEVVLAEAAALPGPAITGVEGFGDDELDEFLASLRR